MSSTRPGTSTPMDLLFPDHDAEIARSRQMLAVVPEGRNDWRPHEKSMTLGRLATHLAELPRFAALVCTTPELDFASGAWTSASADTTAERLAMLETNAAAMKDSISRLDWGTIEESWVVRMGDQVFMKDTRAMHLRQLYSHMTHHRAQLGVFLRLLGVAIPGVYGPSADEM
ncbi:MAG: DinB family protein [Gemmatimonadetes bacterium]|jgi:uncharacterized damage-inducible protein DinB|nr:DinB family protein [Gemmatimonadota bacterium]